MRPRMKKPGPANLTHRATIQLISKKILPESKEKRSVILNLVNQVIEHPENRQTILNQLLPAEKQMVGRIVTLVSGKRLREQDFV